MLHWTKEDTPRRDAAKQRLFGPEELAATGDLRRQVRHARTATS